MPGHSSPISATGETVSPGPPMGLAPRLWPARTPAAQRHLAQQLARLLRPMLTATDALVPREGDHAERADDLRRPGDDVASSEAGLHLRATVHRRTSPPAPGEHRTAIPVGRSSDPVRL